MNKKTTVSAVETLAQSRNHVLLGYTPSKGNANTIPQGNSIHVKCGKCGNIWKPRLQVYLNAPGPSGGCRKCYDRMITDPTIFPNSPFVPRQDVEDRPLRRAGRKTLREVHSKGQYKDIQNREQLIKYLKAHPNKHNDLALDLVIRDTKNAELGIKFAKGTYSKHHVLPLHAQGSPDAWNMISVTKQEHHDLHRLRFDVYRDEGDKKAMLLTNSDLQIASNSVSSVEQSIEEREATKKENRRKASLNRRTPETVKAVEEGMFWKHEKTGTQVIIEPGSAETIEEIRDLLIQSLPTDNKDRQRISSNPSSGNYIRDHIKTVFKTEGSENNSKIRTSVYGFVVKSLE